ncbi:MAG: DUF424 domain-containing protein [Thermoprotei archaeon]|nr:MAG: DUF424 domain-containing protein [Thermoprotei archaeon]RLF18345.1 MAG: DUF424 domain-containing protein [Thermoprotei archaeon]
MTKRVYVKKHIKGSITLIAVCDENILGKTFRDGVLKIEVKHSFYGGELRPIDDELFELLDSANIVNMVGKEIVEEAIRRGFVPRSGVLIIGGVPHVQIVKL